MRRFKQLRRRTILAIAIVLLVFTIGALAFSGELDGVSRTQTAPDVIVTTHAQLQQEINESVAGVPRTIAIDSSIPGGQITGTQINITAGRDITLVSTDPENPVTYRQASSFNRHFVVEGTGAVLTLRDIILQGPWDGVSSAAPMTSGGVALMHGGHLNLEEGGIIERASGNIMGMAAGSVWRSGAALLLFGDSSFHMTGGEIRENLSTDHRWFGIIVLADGSATESSIVMDGGRIHNNINNDNTWGGGVVTTWGGVVTMNGGSIEYNINLRGGWGAGVVLHSGDPQTAFYMNGGIIRENTGTWAPGVGIDGGYMEMSGGYIEDNHSWFDAGGVGLSGTVGASLTMTGGSIRNNTAERDGGGILVHGPGNHAKIEGGSITGNQAAHAGGGIALTSGGSATMIGGVIEHNESPNGGGVWVTSNAATFTMEGGRIANNTAVGSGGGIQATNNAQISMHGGYIEDNNVVLEREIVVGREGGGAVDLWSGAQFTMHDGTIRRNKAPRGGGVQVHNGNTRFIMHGGAITENQAANNGGGIWADNINNAVRLYGGTLNGNKAEHDGGAIFTARYQYGSRFLTHTAAYNNLHIAEDVEFKDNRAFFAFEPPTNAAEFLPEILSRNATVHNHPLNNYDINFQGVLFTATFHSYDYNGDTVVIPLGYGLPLTAPDQGAIDERGWAFWGWFTQEQLEASGRTNPATGQRRPELTDQPFNLTQNFTFQEAGNLDLFAIWRLWGDMNGDDVVDAIDLDYMRRYMLGNAPNDFIHAAADVARDGVLDILDFGRLQRYLAGADGIVLGQP